MWPPRTQEPPWPTRVAPELGIATAQYPKVRAREAWPAPVRLLSGAQPLFCHFRLLAKTNRQICLLSARADPASLSVSCTWAAQSPAPRHDALLSWFHMPYAL